MFTINQITLTSMLGGPFVGVYMLTKNFSISGKYEDEEKIQQVGYFLAMVAIIIAIKLPESSPDVVYAGLLVGIIRFVAKSKQKHLIQASIDKGIPKQSNWKCFVLGLLSLVCTSALIMLMIFVFSILSEWHKLGPN